MKIIFLLFLSIIGFTELGRAEESELSHAVKCHVEWLRDSLDDERWSISVSDTTIVVESRFDVDGYSIVPTPGEMPTKVKHRIELLFTPGLLKEEFVKLAQARLERLKVLRYGSKTKTEYSDARKFLVDNPLPRYAAGGRLGHSFSIYFKSSESRFRGIGPLESYKEVREAEALIDYTFWKLAE
jgi:hypothetical protein